MSSDGGVIVLRENADVNAGRINDTRDPARVHHSYEDMVTARMLATALEIDIKETGRPATIQERADTSPICYSLRT